MWVVIVLVSLAVLITLSLCIPLDLILYANFQEKPKFSLKLKWFFGLFTRELRQTRRKSAEKQVIDYESKSGDWLHGLRITYEILRTKGLFKQLGSFIKRIIRQIKIRELTANFKLGLDNPADTGMLFAFIGPLNLAINYFLPNPIKIEPSFTGESLITGYLYGAVRLWPIQLAASLVGLAFSLPALRAIKKMVLYKWKRKK